MFRPELNIACYPLQSRVYLSVLLVMLLAPVLPACSGDEDTLPAADATDEATDSNETEDESDAATDVDETDAATDDTATDDAMTGETDPFIDFPSPGGSASAPPPPMPPDPEWAGDYALDCEGYGQKLVDCGLLTDGAFFCVEPSTEGDECAFICHAIASCQILQQYNCGGAAPQALTTCFEDCYVAYESFACGSGEYLPASWECDGEADCLDGSDEEDCAPFECESGEEIPSAWECDFESDCEDGSDEADCPARFECDNGAEIPESWECDAFDDCGDGSDEADCNPFTCETTGAVLPEHFVCDQVHDCLDGSDEVGCAELVCE